LQTRIELSASSIQILAIRRRIGFGCAGDGRRVDARRYDNLLKNKEKGSAFLLPPRWAGRRRRPAPAVTLRLP